KTIRVNVRTTSGQANSGAYYESVSGSGRFIAFESNATNLVSGDTNGVTDVFVRDRRTHTTTRVSVRSNGNQLNDWVGYSAISVNGRFVTYCGDASNAVQGDTNGHQDVFVHDRSTGKTTLASVSSSGRQGNADSDYSNVSSNGRWVVFVSMASNLVRGDTNGYWDLFIRDTASGTTRLITRAPNGTPANSDTSYIGPSSLSSDGRFVTFASPASNLVQGDTNARTDVFVYDRETGRIRRASVNTSGFEGNGDSSDPTTSAGGRFVVFDSSATNLVNNDANGAADIFIRDLVKKTTRRVSVSTNEVAGNQASRYPTVSDDGRFVAFESSATNLVGSDTNNASDIFVRDLATGTTRRVSVTSAKEEADAGGDNPFLSASGKYVVFQSNSTNLVANDTNGFTDIFLRGPLR
ncbi:MAG: calcium-binding protein, partial [Actinomycetota bacterium]